MAAGGKLADQEKFKRELHPFDAYDRLKEQARKNEAPKPADNFRWRYYGLFYVAPAQTSYMCRLRIPNGILKHWQLSGLADVAEQFAGQTGPCAACGKPITIPGVPGYAYAPKPGAGGGGGAMPAVVIALVVLGPDKLPEAMRKAGKAYADFKKMSGAFQNEMRSVLDEPLRPRYQPSRKAPSSAQRTCFLETLRADRHRECSQRCSSGRAESRYRGPENRWC